MLAHANAVERECQTPQSCFPTRLDYQLTHKPEERIHTPTDAMAGFLFSSFFFVGGGWGVGGATLLFRGPLSLPTAVIVLIAGRNGAPALFVIYSAFKSPSNQFPARRWRAERVRPRRRAAIVSSQSAQPFVTHISNFLGKQRIFNQSRGAYCVLSKIHWLSGN